jgi:3'(2'),5'-bisphosphate nucleotidase
MVINLKLSIELKKLTIKAGLEILKVYKKPFSRKLKADRSPVTKADLISNQVICKGLKELCPEIAIVSEENINKPAKKNSLFWLVDPLDGTKEFIKKNGEFTVNIALIKNNKPIYGVIYMPVTKELYFTENINSYYSKVSANNKVLKKTKIKVKKRLKNILALSRSHNKDFDFILKKFNANKVIQSGSSIKLCYVAHGKANIYPRLGTTMEWDIAAGDAILRKAGGKIKTLDGKILKYGKKGFKNKSFIARS